MDTGNFVVRYLGETNENGLTNGELYGVETDIEIVAYINDTYVTVWDDEGELHEITSGDYEVVEGEDWFEVVPDHRHTEIN